MLPAGLDQLIAAVLAPQVYALDVITGEQGAGNKTVKMMSFEGRRGKADVVVSLTCGNVNARSRCAVTLVSFGCDCGHVGLTTHKVC